MIAKFGISWLGLLGFACTTLAPDQPLGSLLNPVRCDGKTAEVRYLQSLRCPGGSPPHYHFKRRGPRGPFGNPLDEFRLRCVLENTSHRVLVDRHHPGVATTEPIPGFTQSDDPIQLPTARRRSQKTRGQSVAPEASC